MRKMDYKTRAHEIVHKYFPWPAIMEIHIESALRDTARETSKQSAMVRFGAEVLKEHREEFGDIDGSWLQNKAEELGLLIRVTVTEPCGDNCFCAEWSDFPQVCLRYPDEIRQLIDELCPPTQSTMPIIIQETK